MMKPPSQSEAEFRLWLCSELRRIARIQPHRAKNEALRLSRIGWGKYVCATCKETFGPKDVQADHISPVVPTTGFDSWDGVINRMFCRANGEQDHTILQILCKPCHKDKCREEAGERKMHRAPKKKLKKAIKCKS